MKIGGSERIGHPAREAFLALRDKTDELVEFMPNIEYMKVLEREETPPTVYLYNRWQGTNDDIPKVMRPFVGRDIMGWFDHARWNEETLSCEWQLEAVKEKDRELFECTGNTTLAPDGDGCVFTLAGDLIIHPEKFPGIPKFLARKVQEPVERFVVKLLSPNLTSIATAVRDYLDSRQA